MRYALRTFEDAKPNQVRSAPAFINRLLGRFGLFVVDTEAPEILSISPNPDGVWATVTFGNPKNGEITHTIKVPQKPIRD